MRASKLGCAFAAILLTWQIWPFGVVNTSSFAASTEDRSVFYRLIAHYEHDGQVIDFNLVVGCNVRVTRYGDGDRSYDAFRDPVVYAKSTTDGGAIWQMVPNACQGETTANGQVPADLLPGAIWFESKDDYSLGVAYVTEDAYENSKSQLRFLGASIQAATRDEWVAFQPTARLNLVNPRVFSVLAPWPDEEEVQAHLWDKAKLSQWWLSSFTCSGAQRYRLSDDGARETLREFWPDSRPRFWMPSREVSKEIEQRLSLNSEVLVDHGRKKDVLFLGHSRAEGFPTRTKGGMLRSGKPWSMLPPVIFPMRADDGIPWADPKLSSARDIYRDIDLAGGENKGFAYCYSILFGRGAAGDLHIPNYNSRTFRARVDGQPIAGDELDDTSPSRRPRMFFEADEYFYRRFDFGLN